MLTDIFAERYAAVPVWQSYGESERRLLVQAFRIVSEQLFPYWNSEGKVRDGAKGKWQSMHDRLSMELGLQQLGPLYYQQTTNLLGNPHTAWVPWPLVNVCNAFVCGTYDSREPADRYMKERLSFIEIAFRDAEVALAAENADLLKQIAQAERIERVLPDIPGQPRPRTQRNRAEHLRAVHALKNQSFRASVDELNERLRRAGAHLNYHNGFIQIAEDALIEQQVETPFWSLVSDPKWRNVDTDMKEAIDRRDGNQRDPAFYAARALESTIKIISGEKGWTHGGERGAHSYIDNLASTKNGGFIEKWEQSALKGIFSDVRNELGHGPGGEPMPELTAQQTNWTIETCMAWVRSLVLRM